MTSSEQCSWFTLRAAADAVGVSRVTIRRYLDAGRFPNARREAGREDGRWQVPLNDLIDAGLRVQPFAGDETVAPSDATDTVSVQSLIDTVALQAEVIKQQAATIHHMAAAIVASGSRSEE